MKRVVLVAWLSALVCSLAFAGSAQAAEAHASVIGGAPAGYAYPFMAYIDSEEPGEESSCSGTLVASNLVLTAGHCIVNESTGYLTEPEDVHVLVGSPSVLSGGHWYTARSLYPDPYYRISSSYRDAGLIELGGPIPAPTVALAERQVSPRTTVSFLGWGTTVRPTVGDGEGSTELMIGSSVIQSATYCRRFGLVYAASEICSVDAPTYASGLCFGDSGGPTLVTVGGEVMEVGINDATLHEVGGAECSTTEPDFEISANVEAPWVYRMAEEHEPALPTLTRSQAIHDAFNVLRTGPIRGHFKRALSVSSPL